MTDNVPTMSMASTSSLGSLQKKTNRNRQCYHTPHSQPVYYIGTITGPFFLLGAIFFCIGFTRPQIAKKYEQTTWIIVRGEKSSFLKHSNFNELIDKLYEGRTVPDKHPTVAYEFKEQPIHTNPQCHSNQDYQSTQK